MESKREQAYVGLFVLVVAALLIATVFALSGTLDKADTPYHAYFKNAGGLGPGAEVRYLNGPPVGRISKVQVDPNDPARMKVDFTAKPNIPVKTDSTVVVTSTSPLGENFLEILAGTPAAPLAKRDAILKSKEPVSFADIADKINELTPQAERIDHESEFASGGVESDPGARERPAERPEPRQCFREFEQRARDAGRGPSVGPLDPESYK